MPNRDGYQPGQALTFAEVQRINRRHATSAIDAPVVPQSAGEIDALGKGRVRELLVAHGVDVPAGEPVAKMRAGLKRVMFMEAEG